MGPFSAGPPLGAQAGVTGLLTPTTVGLSVGGGTTDEVVQRIELRVDEVPEPSPVADLWLAVPIDPERGVRHLGTASAAHDLSIY